MINVVNFLAFLFDSNLSASTINSYRSALSSFLPSVDGVSLGSHPMVLRLFRGIRRERPSMPRYSHTWSVDTVLSFLAARNNDSCSFIELSQKLCMLFALCLAARASELSNLRLDGLSSCESELTFTLPCLAKTSLKAGPSTRLFRVFAFPGDGSLCPVRCFSSFLSRSAPLRGDCQYVFVSTRAPHGQVSSVTVSRWLCAVLAQAGIDVSTFKAHSTRAAATSKAAALGLQSSVILAAARWSNENTFTRFYKKDVLPAETFQSSVLHVFVFTNFFDRL